MKVIESFKHDEVLGFKFGSKLMGKPKMFSHVYFIDGLLIDTGHSNMRHPIVQTLRPLAVDQIFITHYHEDHSGNIAPIQKIFDCEVFASELCCQLLKDPPPISFAQKMLWGNRPAYSNLSIKTQTLNTHNYTFELIPIPGHAPDMVALYEPNRQWLFSADLYVNSYIGYFLDDESIRLQMASIKSILSLDFEVLFCSHNPQFRDGKQKLLKKLHFLETFFEQVANLYKKGCSIPEIFKRLQLKEYRFIQFLSAGKLSKLNMVKSVINDLENT